MTAKISKGWREVRLGEVGNFSKGNGVTKNELVKNGVPCIRYGELYTKHDIKIKQFYSFIENKNLDKYKPIKNNSLLFAGAGETREDIGKCASFNHNIEVYAGDAIIILSIDPVNLNATFASFYLNTKGRKQINRLGQGDSIVNIYSRFLQNIKVPCPPISEQNAIASLLEKWDIAIEKTEALIAAKQKQFKWLVKVLTEQKKYINGWREVRLGDVAEINNGKSNSQDANPAGIYPLFDRSMLTKKSDKFLFDKEAVIIPGEGKEFVAKYYYGKFDLHQRCYAIHSFNKNIFPKFCYYYLMNSSNYFRRVAIGSTVPSLRLGHFQMLSILLPSLSEQKTIVRTLNTAQQEIILLEQLAAQYRVQKRGLMNKLLTGEWRISA